MLLLLEEVFGIVAREQLAEARMGFKLIMVISGHGRPTSQRATPPAVEFSNESTQSVVAMPFVTGGRRHAGRAASASRPP